MARRFTAASSERIDLANESAFDFERTDSWTVALRWYAETAGTQALVAKRLNGGTNRGWLLFQTETPAPGVWVQIQSDEGGGNRIVFRTTTKFAVGSWRSVVWTYDGSSTAAGNHIYVDGVDQALTVSVDALSATILNDVAVQIGALGGAASPTAFFDGRAAEVAIWTDDLSAAEAATLGDGYSPLFVRPSALLSYLPLLGNNSPESDVVGGNNGTLTGTTKAAHPRIFMPGGARLVGVPTLGAFELDADPGSYALTGSAAGALADRMLTAAPGDYALTGAAASVPAGRVVSADPGSYALTGLAASLLATRTLEATPGVYAVTGSDAQLVAGRILSADPGAYVLTGELAALLAGRAISSDAGAYVITGTTASLIADRLLAALPGSYALTGFAATLEAGTAVIIVTGHFDSPTPAAGALDSPTPTASTFDSPTPGADMFDQPTPS